MLPGLSLRGNWAMRSYLQAMETLRKSATPNAPNIPKLCVLSGAKASKKVTLQKKHSHEAFRYIYILADIC